jgi:tRNA uridine 5-carboxymethylaminomethyl modification enzyme
MVSVPRVARVDDGSRAAATPGDGDRAEVELERPSEPEQSIEPTERRQNLRAIDWLARPEGTYRGLRAHGVAAELPEAWGECLDVRVRYRGYIERQRRAAEQAAALDRVTLPEALWDAELLGLSREAREKLVRWRPGTAAHASRIAGVSPADVAILMIHARRLATVA